MSCFATFAGGGCRIGENFSTAGGGGGGGFQARGPAAGLAGGAGGTRCIGTAGGTGRSANFGKLCSKVAFFAAGASEGAGIGAGRFEVGLATLLTTGVSARLLKTGVLIFDRAPQSCICIACITGGFLPGLGFVPVFSFVVPPFVALALFTGLSFALSPAGFEIAVLLPFGCAAAVLPLPAGLPSRMYIHFRDHACF